MKLKVCSDQEMAVIFAIQVNLVPIPVQCGEGNTNSSELLLLALNYQYGHFLANTLDFIAFYVGFLVAARFFRARLFWIIIAE